MKIYPFHNKLGFLLYEAVFKEIRATAETRLEAIIKALALLSTNQ